MVKVREMDIEFYHRYSEALEATKGPAWRYDETKPCGVNYNSVLLAGLYDAHHRAFRDYRREGDEIIAMLDLTPNATVIDMGCGTGAFALHAATHYRTVYAVDVSRAMLRRTCRKARKAGLSNVECHQGGFLTYEHDAAPADAIVTVAALHHLPDFWKLVGLHRLASMLKPEGRLYLFDVVFSFDVAHYEARIRHFVRTTATQMGPSGRAESEIHCRAEYSTCDWIMTGLLERAGFEITTTAQPNECFAGYLCTRRSA
jgi:cyclopropane fatty-acyl-phospholipid synthase-like methyltransferase